MMSYFGIILLFMLVGFLFSFPTIKKDKHLAFYAALFLLLAGYANYIGWSVRAFAMRFFWPIYLSVFFGFGLYVLVKLFRLKLNVYHAFVVSLIFLVLFIGVINIPFIPKYTKIQGSIVDPYHWGAFKWIEENTAPDSKVYFFYGDLYDNDAVLRNTKRVTYLVITNDYIESLNNRTIKREYYTEVPADTGGGMIKRTGLFSYELRVGKDEPYMPKDRDICNFDYYVFDRYTGIQQLQSLISYNSYIRQLFLDAGMEEVYSNEILSILKNNAPGEDCIAREGVKIE
jgi:hypothetical protein